MQQQSAQIRILVAIDELPSPVWKKFQRQVQATFVRDGASAYRELIHENYDISFIDLFLTGLDSLELLRRIRDEKLCSSVVLTSETPSFHYAQQGILYGVSAYLLRPLDEQDLAHVFSRYLAGNTPNAAPLQKAAEDIASHVRKPEFTSHFLEIGKTLMTLDDSPIEQSLRWRDLYEAVVLRIYRVYPWLRLYYHPEEFLRADFIREQDTQTVRNTCLRKSRLLHAALIELLPPEANEEMTSILIYLLRNLEQNLQQKEVAEHFYITNSTLSARFQTHLGYSYRDYMTRVKMIRARYLIRYSDLELRDLAGRLGYKDREYFSELFEQRTGQSLAAYAADHEGTHYVI
ncbi:MAG: helix-turn-helix domain-containing protein [Oscillospiraceae bacterium]|nr:helix-turn-helix domain-containing protein [Oscillospiraceae bacterium]